MVMVLRIPVQCKFSLWYLRHHPFSFTITNTLNFIWFAIFTKRYNSRIFSILSMDFYFFFFVYFAHINITFAHIMFTFTFGEDFYFQFVLAVSWVKSSGFVFIFSSSEDSKFCAVFRQTTV